MSIRYLFDQNREDTVMTLKIANIAPQEANTASLDFQRLAM